MNFLRRWVKTKIQENQGIFPTKEVAKTIEAHPELVISDISGPYQFYEDMKKLRAEGIVPSYFEDTLRFRLGKISIAEYRITCCDAFTFPHIMINVVTDDGLEIVKDTHGIIRYEMMLQDKYFSKFLVSLIKAPFVAILYDVSLIEGSGYRSWYKKIHKIYGEDDVYSSEIVMYAEKVRNELVRYAKKSIEVIEEAAQYVTEVVVLERARMSEKKSQEIADFARMKIEQLHQIIKNHATDINKIMVLLRDNKTFERKGECDLETISFLKGCYEELKREVDRAIVAYEQGYVTTSKNKT